MKTLSRIERKHGIPRAQASASFLRFLEHRLHVHRRGRLRAHMGWLEADECQRVVDQLIAACARAREVVH